MSGARFTLRLASGEIVDDVRIQGRGGEIGAGTLHCPPAVHVRDARRTIEAALRFAGRRPMAFLFEPQPGHVRAWVGPWKGTRDEETTRDLDIRGAELINVRPSWSYAEMPKEVLG